jgi:hypothetical protein
VCPTAPPAAAVNALSTLRGVRAARLPAVIGLLAVSLVLPAGARADGDPASDVLLTQRQYLPYKPPTGGRIKALLERATAALARTGEPVRVALIGSPTDLGAVPDFFGRPQEYAPFLSKELELGYHGGLVVVMPAGLGTAKLSAAARRAVDGLAVSSGASSTALARTAIFALQRVAAADGHPIPTLLAEDTGPGVRWGRAVAGLVLAALLAGVAVAATHRIRRRAATGAVWRQSPGGKV